MLLLLLFACGEPAQPRQLGEEAAEALGSARLDHLLSEERRIEQRLPSEEDPLTAEAALAMVRLESLYFEPSPEHLAQVESWAAEHPEEPSRLVRAALALREGNVAQTRRILGPSPPADDEERILYGRIALAGGEPLAGIPWLDALKSPGTPRARLLRAQLWAAGGKLEEARQEVRSLLLDDPDCLSAQVLRVELAQPEVQVQLADLVQVRYQLPTRLRARVLGVQAMALLKKGEFQKALAVAEVARTLDGTNPDALLVIADGKARKGSLREAWSELSSAPSTSAEAQVALLLLLLDLDRMEDAEKMLDHLESTQAQAGLLPGLRFLLAVAGKGERPEGPTPPPSRPALVYARLLAAAQALEPSAVEQITEALPLLEAATNPFEERLTGRLLVQRAILEGPEAGQEDARTAIIRWPEDPGVHLWLGLYYEAGQKTTSRALAAAHLSRATSIGPDFARAWYERGRFYQDAPDEHTREAWTRYLALGPSGARARRATEFLVNQAQK